MLTLEVTLTSGLVKRDILFQRKTHFWRQTNLLYLESCIRHPWAGTLSVATDCVYHPELLSAPHKASESSFIKWRLNTPFQFP